MSKDKGGREVKKAAAVGPKKAGSDYQSGKKSVSQDLPTPKKK